MTNNKLQKKKKRERKRIHEKILLHTKLGRDLGVIFEKSLNIKTEYAAEGGMGLGGWEGGGKKQKVYLSYY